MNPFTIGTLLNSAPMIIQAAGKLVDLIRERGQGAPASAEKVPVTPDNLEEVIGRLHARLESMDEASVEQLKLIEQLARQAATARYLCLDPGAGRVIAGNPGAHGRLIRIRADTDGLFLLGVQRGAGADIQF